MSIVVVYNPSSRLPLSEVEQLFRRHAPADRLRIIESSREEATPQLIAPELSDASMVVAVGGDGTVSGTAAGLLCTGLPLGIIPAGSTNMIARVNRVPLNTEQAVQLITGRHNQQMIDAGQSGDRVLLHLGGAGLDARIFERASAALKQRLKWMAYGPAAFRSIGDAASRLIVSVDGVSVEVESRLVLMANSGALIRESLTLMPEADRTDGLFDVGIFTADSWPAIAATAAQIPVLRWKKSPHIIRMRGAEIAVDAIPPLPYEFDGDVIGTTPFHVTVRPRSICMVCGN